MIQKQLNDLKQDEYWSSEEIAQYESLLWKYQDAFGQKQSCTKMSNLPAMGVRILPGTKPFRAEPRAMGYTRLKAMQNKINDLLKMGMLKRAENPYFSCACFMVPKSDGSWRLVVDLRPMNDCCEFTAYIMAPLEEQLSWLPNNCKYFAGLDFLSGFDMLRVKKKDTQYFGISTPWGIFLMLGAPMGFKNTPAVFMERMITDVLGGTDTDGGVFARHPAGALQWLDDTLVFGDTFSGFLESMEVILKNCIEVGLRLNVHKCSLLQKEIVWCGRIVSVRGWRFKEIYFKRIMEIPEPKTMGELEIIVYLATWLSATVPNCCELKNELQEKMGEIKKLLVAKFGKMNKKKRKSMSISTFWTVDLARSFMNLKVGLQNAMEKNLALYNMNQK